MNVSKMIFPLFLGQSVKKWVIIDLIETIDEENFYISLLLMFVLISLHSKQSQRKKETIKVLLDTSRFDWLSLVNLNISLIIHCLFTSLTKLNLTSCPKTSEHRNQFVVFFRYFHVFTSCFCFLMFYWITMSVNRRFQLYFCCWHLVDTVLSFIYILDIC